MKKWLLWLGLVAVVLVAGFYQWNQYLALQSREQLLKRANEYWQAMQLNDLHTIYRMTSATAEGRLRPDESYKGNSDGIRIVRYEIEVVEMGRSAATVKVKTTITFPEINGKEIQGADANESWVRIKGDWYHDNSKTSNPLNITAGKS